MGRSLKVSQTSHAPQPRHSGIPPGLWLFKCLNVHNQFLIDFDILSPNHGFPWWRMRSQHSTAYESNDLNSPLTAEISALSSESNNSFQLLVHSPPIFELYSSYVPLPTFTVSTTFVFLQAPSLIIIHRSLPCLLLTFYSFSDFHLRFQFSLSFYHLLTR